MNITTTSQQKTSVVFKYPLLHPAAIQAACGLDRVKMVAEIESGGFEYVFDLKMPDAVRTCPRIFLGSLDNYLAKQQGQPERSYSLPEVLQAILLVNLPALNAVYVARQFSIGSDLMHSLIRARVFKILVPATVKRGRTSSPGLCRKSVEAFLTERRVF